MELPARQPQRDRLGAGSAQGTHAQGPDDPRQFDTYRFADHKERVIDLLARVVRVSVETLRIVQAVKGATR